MAPSSAAEACAEGDWSAAIKLYTAELDDADAPSPPVLCNRALCYSMLDLHRKALKDAEAALLADPHFILAYLRKGLALQALGRREAAAAAWDSGYRLALSTSADMELALRLRRLALQEAPPPPPAGADQKAPPAGAGEQSRSPNSIPSASPDPATPPRGRQAGGGAAAAAGQGIVTANGASVASENGAPLAQSQAVGTDSSEAAMGTTSTPMSSSSNSSSTSSSSASSSSSSSSSSSNIISSSSASSQAASKPSSATKAFNATGAPAGAPKAQTTPTAASPANPSGPAPGTHQRHTTGPTVAGAHHGPIAKGTTATATATATATGSGSGPGGTAAPRTGSTSAPAAGPGAATRQAGGPVTKVPGLVTSERRGGVPGHAGSLPQRLTMPTDLFLTMGIQQVNAGKLDLAIETFEQILEGDRRSVGALIGRGTALALQHKLEAAVRDFSEGIAVNPRIAEAWKRRAQARAALGLPKEAVEDFNRALEIDPTATRDVLLERGTLFVKLKDYKAALQDLRAAVSLEPSNKLAYNFMGLALVGCGECVEGVRAYKKALGLDPGMHEAWVNMGQAHKELADAPKAAECFQRAIALDPKHVQAYRIYALLKYGLGDHKGAAQTAEQGLGMSPQCVELLYLFASAMHATGEYRVAVRSYDDALGVESKGEEQVLQFLSFYQREIALYTASKLNEPLSNFKPDTDLQPHFKEAWGKKLPPTLLFPGYTPQPMLPAGSLLRRRKDQASGTPSALRQRLLDAADRLGRRTQYSCPGFLPNARQHRMAGLAILELMQVVSAAWQGHTREGAAASAASSSASNSVSGKKAHKKGSKGSKAKEAAQHSAASASPAAPLPASAPGPTSRSASTSASASGLMSATPSASESASGSQRAGIPDTEGTGTNGANANGSSSHGGSGSDSEGGGGGRPESPGPALGMPRGMPGVCSAGTGPGAGEKGEALGMPRGMPGVCPSGAGEKGGALGPLVSSLKWRDAFNITVRWRQISEPCDPVTWVDLLTEKEFAAGFGSHTPLLIGQTRVVRYYSNFPRAFRIMKQQLLQTGAAFNANNVRIPLADQELRRAVAAAKDPKELWDLVGEDFWTVTHCQSMARPGATLDGTRLTLVQSPTGFDFAIRTPGTPQRWAEYDAEMTAAWEELGEAVWAQEQQGPAASASERSAARERIQNAILRLGYYWYNFMPLARGTAMVGLATMLGLLMAANMEVTQTVPRGMQVDWEAILSSSFEAFASSVRPWMLQSLRADSPFRALAKVSEVLPTIGSVVSALSSIGDKS